MVKGHIQSCSFQIPKQTSNNLVGMTCSTDRGLQTKTERHTLNLGKNRGMRPHTCVLHLTQTRLTVLSLSHVLGRALHVTGAGHRDSHLQGTSVFRRQSDSEPENAAPFCNYFSTSSLLHPFITSTNTTFIQHLLCARDRALSVAFSWEAPWTPGPAHFLIGLTSPAMPHSLSPQGHQHPHFKLGASS